jgi:hypothetical protein
MTDPGGSSQVPGSQHRQSPQAALPSCRQFSLLFSRSLTHRIEMPIRPENRWLYPIDWEQLSASVRFKRTGSRCDHCGRPHLRRVIHLETAGGGTPTPGAGGHIEGDE